MRAPQEQRAPADKTHERNWRRYLPVLALLTVAAIILVAFIFKGRLPEVEEDLGAAAYGGVFLIVLLSNASLVVPLPGAAVIAVAGSLLAPFWVGLVSGVASTLGETTGYLLGFSGRGVVENRKFYERAVGLLRRMGWLVLLLLAIIPSPLFDVAGVAAGALRYPLWKFLIFVGIGKTIKSLGLAYAGYYGLSTLLKWLQIG